MWQLVQQQRGVGYAWLHAQRGHLQNALWRWRWLWLWLWRWLCAHASAVLTPSQFSSARQVELELKLKQKYQATCWRTLSSSESRRRQASPSIWLAFNNIRISAAGQQITANESRVINMHGMLPMVSPMGPTTDDDDELPLGLCLCLRLRLRLRLCRCLCLCLCPGWLHSYG